ncbi:MAG: PAS domain S-box protein [Acidobacteriota bacterium]
MADRMNERALAFFAWFSRCSAVLATLFGVIVLTGWALHIQALKVVIPGQVAVKANTGACFILIGLAFWLVIEEKERGRTQRGVSRFLALTASVVGLLSLVEVCYGWDPGVDQMLFRAGAEDIPGSVRPGLMSGITAADFFLLGVIISLFDARAGWARGLQSIFAAGAAAASLFGILDFVLDPEKTHTHIAPATALILFLLSLAVLCARTHWGLGALLASASAGGQLCRRLLPGTILVPMAIAWLRWKGQQVGFYSEWMGLAIVTVAAATLLVGLTLWTAAAMRRTDTEQRQAEERARHLAAIVTCSSEAIVGKTLDGIVTSWNLGAETTYGYSAEEMIGQCVTRVIPPDRLEEFHDFLRRLRRGETIQQYETERTRKDGKRISVSITVSPLRDDAGNVAGASTITRDITDRRQAEQKLRRINQTLQALSACTDRMMRASEESGMLQQVCDAVIEVGGYRMAWVGYAEHDQNKSVRPVAHSGMEAGYLLTANITWADVERGRGPTGVAVRTGKTVVSRDFAKDSRLGPWRKEAARCGFQSSIALPLRSEDQILGAVTVYSADIDAFDSREEQLLEQLSVNLSYAIMALRARAQSDFSAQKLRESALYVRSLLEASLDPLVTINKEGKITDVNQATEKATGISRDRLIGSDFCDYFTHPQKARAGYQRVFEQGLVRDYLLAIRSTSGAVLDVLYNGTVFKGANGEVEGVFAAARDITERKRAEEALHRSESRYRSLVTATAQIVWTTNPDGEVVDDMPMWRAYTGMNRQQIAGAGWLDSLHPDDRSRTEQVWGKAWRNRERYDTEYRIRSRDGEYRTFSVRGVPVLEDDGTVREWVGTCTDITQRKQAEEQVHLLNEQLEQRVKERTAQLEAANRELEAFTYSVSHDLRAPLRHISGFSKILSEEFSESLPAEAKHQLQRIQEGTRRMGQLVDDLLNLGRVGRKELSLQVAGVRSIVDDIIADLQSDVGERQVEWKIGDLPYIECDTSLTQQVFQNLLSNALKFTRPRAHAVIEIGQERRDGEAVLYVRDNGVGFSMKYADKLFGVFQRLHRAEDFEGTGVGLATVQRIIQKHGGRIWAEADLDKGATFYLTLGNFQKNEVKTDAVGAGGQA